MLGILEETGLIVKASYHYLDIEELFDVWKHINHYFVCEYIEDTGKQHLTEAEKKAGCTFVWVSLDKAIELFAKYADYRDTNIADYGLYHREYNALIEYKEQISSFK